MMLKLARFFLFVFVMVGLFVHCSGICFADSKKEKVILKMATLAPEGVGWAILIKDSFASAINKATDGVVDFDWYWGGIMGDDEDYIAKIRIDQLQGAGVSASGIVMACPDIVVFELPFLFNNFDEVNYVRTKHVTPCKIRYSPGGILISMKAWNRIPEKYHKAIKEVLPQQEQEINDFGHDSNRKCLKAMIKYGVNEVKLTLEEIDLLKKRTRPVWDKLAGKDYSRELLDEILLYLSEYRSKNATI